MTKNQAMRKVERASAQAKAAALKRNQLIVVALEHGSVRDVAVAAGLSPARVHQIRHGR